ncbi:MAG: hypothetical protein RLO81_09200 [Fulvivirga sp.]|uniref:hypothetical protein n=1 Tax=Fulvivirga sp. TaxID=1931237 RepID=UPI0032EFC91A
MAFQFALLGKSNLYGRILIFVLFILITVLLSSESSFLLGEPVLGPKIGGSIFSILQIGFLLYSIQLLKALGPVSKNIIRFLYIYAIVGAVVGLYIANPFVEIFDIFTRRYLYILFHIINTGLFLLISFYILRDIFASKATHSDHIWGALVAYLLTIFVFGDIYEIITLIKPGLLGQVYEMGWPNYLQCVMYSMNAMSGIDSAYPDSHSLLKKIAILEYMIGNLFLVVILGRLLSHPLKK